MFIAFIFLFCSFIFFFFLIDCKMCFDTNKNVAVFLSPLSLRHLMQSNHSFFFFLFDLFDYIYSVYLYMYEYKYIYIYSR